MKNYLRTLYAFMSILLSCNASAASADIDGSWRGTLTTAPGSEMVVEFVIESISAGLYSATINTPESSAIKDVSASSVSYNDGLLYIAISELSGVFEAKFEDNSLKGNWTQVGESFPLVLTPYGVPVFSDDIIASISGQWEGTITRGETPLQAVVWRFEGDEEGHIIGLMGPRAQGTATIPMQNILVSDSEISFTVNAANGKYSGSFFEGGIDGMWSQGQEVTLNMTRRVIDQEAANRSFSAELIASIEGEWEGTIVDDESRSTDIVWRFEIAEAGKVLGFMGPAARGVASIPMQNINITASDLSFDVYDAGGSFSGKFSASGVEGTWNQGAEASITMRRKDAP